MVQYLTPGNDEFSSIHVQDIHSHYILLGGGVLGFFFSLSENNFSFPSPCLFTTSTYKNVLHIVYVVVGNEKST